MNLKIQIICVLLLLAKHLYAQNEVLDGLRNQLKQTSASMPADYNTVVQNLQGNAQADIAYFTNAEYSYGIKRFGFPEQIEQKFNQIVYSQQVSFSTFSTSIVHSQFEHSEFIGIARNVNGVITIGYVQAYVTGQSTKPPIPDCSQFQSVMKKAICVITAQDIIAKSALTTDEIMKIEQSLKAYACQLANQKLNNVPNSFYQYEEQQDQYENSLFFMSYVGKQCNKVMSNCPYTQNNNCLFFHCEELPLLDQLTDLCQKAINVKKQACKAYLEEYGNNECLKCVCINFKLNQQENVNDCY